MNINVNNVKICVTVPSSKTEDVRKAMWESGAGEIGTNYKECSSITKTIGSFRPINNASPAVGELNKLEFVEEDKIEVICNVDRVKDVVDAVKKVHPYEEPAIDIYPLLDIESFK